ncbi:WD40 repeat protein [Myxozyma melibiosi]|uniref:WD40 repeat protein n=1 Tax=Myxozyma melibiosi TaxID=54550 RepID=A0ABR1FF42_9ASCO
MSKQYFSTGQTTGDHPTDIFAVATTPEYVVTVTGDSIIRIYDALSPDHQLARQIHTPHRTGIHHLSVSKDADLISAVGFDGSISLWTLSEGKEKSIISDTAKTFWAVAFSPDGIYLAATAIDGNLTVWDVRGDDPEVCGNLETKGTPGLCIDYSNDGRYIATGHENGGLYIFDTETSRLSYSLLGHTSAVRTVAFSPLSKLLAAGGDSNVVTVYSVKSSEMVMLLPGHTRWIMSLDWNFEGEYLLTGSFDKSLKVWSIDQKECVATLTDAVAAVWNVKWTKTGGTGRSQGFVSVGADKALRWYREATGG